MKGVVSIVHANPWTDRKSGEQIHLYSFKVEGDDTWYRIGQDEPNFKKGQSIQFETKDAKNNVDLKSVSVLATETAVSPKVSAPSSPRQQSSYQSRDGYWEGKEQRDLAKDERYQAVDIPRMTFCTSQDAAVALVTSALQHDCLPKLKTDNKAGRLKTLLAYVDEITDRFFKQRMNATTEDDPEVNEEEAPTSKEKTLDD